MALPAEVDTRGGHRQGHPRPDAFAMKQKQALCHLLGAFAGDEIHPTFMHLRIGTFASDKTARQALRDFCQSPVQKRVTPHFSACSRAITLHAVTS